MPTATSATGTRRSEPASMIRASAGASSASASTERRVRSSANVSSVVPSANSTSTQAPSAYAPMPTAPTLASAISTFMSRTRRRSAIVAARATGQPPTAIESRYTGSATSLGAESSVATTAEARIRHASTVETARASRRQNGWSDRAARRCSTGRAENPARVTAAMTASASGLPQSSSDAEPNDTRASSTPATPPTARSSVRAQEAQSMPSTR